MPFNPCVTGQVDGMEGMWCEAMADTVKADTWQQWRESPKGFPTHQEVLQSKGSFRNGKIRDVLAFSSLPKLTVTVPAERQQETSPSGFLSKLCLPGTDISVCFFFLSCILLMHWGNYTAPNRCSIIYWLMWSILLFMEHCWIERMESLLVPLNGVK